ncbi:Glutathione gamma-glutamylcysteinyltransferase [Exaiptasia diaphana]|nr:Glutathione gamma-glutamylcysteinyltransferase [Exaiptasia diaphana]
MLMATSKSFYCRNLPKCLVDYRSNESKVRLVRSLSKGTAVPFLSLSSCFNTQSEPAFCGLSTLAIILNSLRIDPQRLWKTPWRWFSEELLHRCRPSEAVKNRGVTMEEFQCLAACNGALCKLVRPKGNEKDFKMFSKALFCTCTGGRNLNCEKKDLNCYERENITCESENFDEENPSTYMAISFNRKVLNQTGTGHYSPVAAYDEESNSALILDTARFKYPPYWVSLQVLFQSMLAVDDTTGKSRGYFLITPKNEFQGPSRPTPFQDGGRRGDDPGVG